MGQAEGTEKERPLSGPPPGGAGTGVSSDKTAAGRAAAGEGDEVEAGAGAFSPPVQARAGESSSRNTREDSRRMRDLDRQTRGDMARGRPYTLPPMPGSVNETPHAAPPRATFRQKIGGPGGISSFLIALVVGALGLGLPVLWRMRFVLKASRRDERRRVEAILVLGRLLEADRPSPVFVRRLDHAFALWRAGIAPRIVIAGGLTGKASRTEAAAGREHLLARGVPAEAVWTEEHSQHTLENLFYVRARLRELGLGSIVVVSDPLHLARAATMAGNLGLDVACSGAPDCPPPRGSAGWWLRAGKEAFLLHWYHCGFAYSRLIRSERQLARVT